MGIKSIVTIFWMLYGFARRNAVIWVPNSIAMSLSCVQMVLCCIYPRTTSVGNDDDGNDDDDDDSNDHRNDDDNDGLDAVDPTPLLLHHQTNSNDTTRNRRNVGAETTMV